jgi:hypothetical protein
MNLATANERRLTLAKRVPHSVFPGDPTLSRHREEELSKPGFMRADHTGGIEAENIRMSVTAPGRDFDRRDTEYLVGTRADR